MAESNDLTQALTEYGSAASPYSALDDYLMQRPVFDRGVRQAPDSPTLRTLEAITPDTDQLLAEQYDRIIAEQQAADEAATLARQTEINNLRDLLREELATSEDAALSQRSDITKSLEGRIADLQSDIDAETLGLRQAGLDERAALARQIEEGDRLVRQAQEAAIGDLSDTQSSLVRDLKERIGSLSDDLTSVNQTIDEKYLQLDADQKASADLAQTELSTLNEQLNSLQQAVDAENLRQSEELRNETSNLLAGLEGKISGVSDELSTLQIPELQQQISDLSQQASDLNQTAQAATDERSALAEQIRGLTDRQSTKTADLATRLENVSETLNEIDGRIDSEIENLSSLAQEQAVSAQAEIDSLNQQLESLYTDVESGNAAQSETIRNETANLIAGLEQQVGGLADNLGALPIESIQSQLAAVNDQTAQFQQAVDAATGQRAELASRIDALQAAGLTQDDLTAAINPIAQQRQEAISAAVNPIQAQIEALRGEIPQQIDTEALRQQITDEIMANLPQQQSAEGQQGVSVEPEADAYADLGPSASEAAGFNPYGGGSAADMNVSDGRADALGLFDDPRPMQQFNPSSEIRDTIAVPTPRQNQMTSRAGAFIPETTVAPTASNVFSNLVGLQAANGSADTTPVVSNVAIRADRTPKRRATVPTTPSLPKIKPLLPTKKPLPVLSDPFRFNRFTR
jgi:chromosome segregation ATPase